MKRFVLFFLLAILLSPFVAIAQSRDKVTGAMVVTTTESIVKQPVVTPKEEPVKEKKKLKAVEIKRGYQQEVSLAYSLLLNGRGISMFNINYIGGYRINQHLFVGLGTGLDFGCSFNFKPYIMEDDGLVCSGPSKYHEESNDEWGWAELPIQKVSVPLYANFKVYFMKTRWAPFLSFSAGMRISGAKKLEVYSSKDVGSYWYENKDFDQYLYTDKYGAVTGMFEVMPGVSFQYNKKLAFNFQFGYATRQTYGWENDWLTSNDVYRVQAYWSLGFTMRLGVVF